MSRSNDGAVTKQFTRRELCRMAALATGAPVLWSLTACKQTTTERLHTKNEQPSVPLKSVFQESCRANNEAKYDNLDESVVYGPIAFWFMLTTDEWDQCLQDPAWRSRLAAEFQMEPRHLEFLYKAAYDDTLIEQPPYVFSNRKAFSTVRKMWQDFIQSPPPVAGKSFVYGRRPCLGGATLLQIARQFKTPQNAPALHSVFQDSCRADNQTKYATKDEAIVYGPAAFWLMLTTDEWDTCSQDAAWRARLVTELGMEPVHLEYLNTNAHDDRKVGDGTGSPYIYSNLKLFTQVKKVWQDFITSPPYVPGKSFFYGKRPCPGGKTLLQIAGGHS